MMRIGDVNSPYLSISLSPHPALTASSRACLYSDKFFTALSLVGNRHLLPGEFTQIYIAYQLVTKIESFCPHPIGRLDLIQK